MARAALAAEGIDAFVHGADSTTVLEWTVTGGVQLQVREEDAEAADAIINQLLGLSHAEEVTPSDEEPWEPPLTCEQCGSPEIEKRQKLVAFSLIAAFIAAIGWVQASTQLAFFLIVAIAALFVLAPSWRCRHCGHTW